MPSTRSPVHPSTLRRSLCAVALCGPATFLTACASPPAPPQGLVPAVVEVARQHPHSVQLVVTGGAEMAPAKAAWSVSDAALAEALTTSIHTQKIFATVLSSTIGGNPGAEADYRLSVNFVGGEATPSGAGFTAKADLEWSLETIDGKWIWQHSLPTWGSAQGDEGSQEDDRLRLAIARALRENIAQGLSRISKLAL